MVKKDIPEPQKVDVADLTAERSRRRSDNSQEPRSSGTGPRWKPGDDVTAPVVWEEHETDLVPDDGTHVPRDEEPVEPRYHNVTDLLDSDGYDEDAIVTCTKYADEESRKVQFQLSEHTVRLVEVMVANSWVPGIQTPADAYRNAIHHGIRRYVERHQFDPQLAAERERFINKQTLRSKVLEDQSNDKSESELVGLLKGRIEYHLACGAKAQAAYWVNRAKSIREDFTGVSATQELDELIKRFEKEKNL